MDEKMDEKLEVVFFPNGSTVVFARNGEQVPELQESWVGLYASFLQENGIDPTEVVFQMPNQLSVKVFLTESGHWSRNFV